MDPIDPILTPSFPTEFLLSEEVSRRSLVGSHSSVVISLGSQSIQGAGEPRSHIGCSRNKQQVRYRSESMLVVAYNQSQSIQQSTIPNILERNAKTYLKPPTRYTMIYIIIRELLRVDYRISARLMIKTIYLLVMVQF